MYYDNIYGMTEENSNTKKNTEWSDREMGALWRKRGSTDYLTGHFKTKELGQEVVHKVVIFANKHKGENERAPDLIIYKSKDMQSNNAPEVKVEQAEPALASEVPEELF